MKPVYLTMKSISLPVVVVLFVVMTGRPVTDGFNNPFGTVISFMDGNDLSTASPVVTILWVSTIMIPEDRSRVSVIPSIVKSIVVGDNR